MTNPFIESKQSLPYKFSAFQFLLTQQQALYLQSKLPKLYSFQEVKKNIKRQKKDSLSKIQSRESKTSLTKQCSVKQFIQIPQELKLKRNRSKKVDRYLQEEIIRPKSKHLLHQTLSEEQNSKALLILNQLKKHPKAWPFLQPVNPEELGIPDYFDIIKEPMDLSSVQKNLKNNQYSTINQFHGDLNKIWANSYRYNDKSTQVYNLTVQMEKFYRKIINKGNEQNNLKKQKEQGQIKNKKKKGQSTNKVGQNEKKQIYTNIKKLPKQYLSGIWSIVVGHTNTTSTQIQFDIEELEYDKIMKLQKYINECLQKMNKSDNKIKSRQQLGNKQKVVANPRISSNNIQSNQSSFFSETD